MSNNSRLPIGEIIKGSDLTWRVYTASKEAPPDIQQARGDLLDLYYVLQTFRDDVVSPDSLLATGADPNIINSIANTVDATKKELVKLQTLIDKNRYVDSLGRSTYKVVSQTHLTEFSIACNSIFQLTTILEDHFKKLGGTARNTIKTIGPAPFLALDDKVHELLSFVPSTRRSSFSQRESTEGKQEWKTLMKAFMKAGARETQIKENTEFIEQFIEKLVEDDGFEEDLESAYLNSKYPTESSRHGRSRRSAPSHNLNSETPRRERQTTRESHLPSPEDRPRRSSPRGRRRRESVSRPSPELSTKKSVTPPLTDGENEERHRRHRQKSRDRRVSFRMPGEERPQFERPVSTSMSSSQMTPEPEAARANDPGFDVAAYIRSHKTRTAVKEAVLGGEPSGSRPPRGYPRRRISPEAPDAPESSKASTSSHHSDTTMHSRSSRDSRTYETDYWRLRREEEELIERARQRTKTEKEREHLRNSSQEENAEKAAARAEDAKLEKRRQEKAAADAKAREERHAKRAERARHISSEYKKERH